MIRLERVADFIEALTPQQKLGRKIAAYRAIKQMTQRRLGETLKIPQATISAYETGRSEPSFLTMVQIADILSDGDLSVFR